MRNGTSDLWIPRSDALPQTRHRDSSLYDTQSYKHDSIDITDPGCMQDACHMKFLIDLAHRRVSVAQW